MRIKMQKGVNLIEWTLIGSGPYAVKQVDKSGTWRVPFDSTDTAGAWMVAQAIFARDEMGFTFTNL